MSECLVALTSGTRLITGPHKLPKPLPDIDLIIEDLQAEILVVAELKWSRKPIGVHERRVRDAEVAKGVKQLRLINNFLDRNPRHLCDLNRITRAITEYSTVHYCIIAQDHFPESIFPDYPIYSYEACLRELKLSRDTNSILYSLSNFDWLPVEGVDFFVRFEANRLSGITVESETYYPPEGPLALLT